MKKHPQPNNKPTLKVCADLKAHIYKEVDEVAAPKVATQNQCQGNICSLTDWKPRKRDAA